MRFKLFSSRNRIKKYEIVGTCSTNERKGRAYRNLVGKLEDNLEELAMDVKIILKWVFKK